MVNSVISICTDNTTLNSTLQTLKCVITDAGETCRTIISSSLTNCPSGCNTDIFPNACNPTTFETNLLFFGIVIVIVIILAFVARKYS